MGKGRDNASNSDDQVLTPSELYDKKRRRTGSTVDRVEPLSLWAREVGRYTKEGLILMYTFEKPITHRL